MPMGYDKSGMFGATPQTDWMMNQPRKERKPYEFDPSQFGTGEAGQRMQDLLEQQSRGEGPSLARGVMQQGLEQSIKNQRSQTAGMMGTNPALAAKLGGQQGAEMTQMGMQQAGQVGLQEQMAAQQALAEWLQQQRQAQMQMQFGQAQQQNIFDQMQMQRKMNQPDVLGTVANIGGSIMGAGLF